MTWVHWIYWKIDLIWIFYLCQRDNSVRAIKNHVFLVKQEKIIYNLSPNLIILSRVSNSPKTGCELITSLNLKTFNTI